MSFMLFKKNNGHNTLPWGTSYISLFTAIYLYSTILMVTFNWAANKWLFIRQVVTLSIIVKKENKHHHGLKMVRYEALQEDHRKTYDITVKIISILAGIPIYEEKRNIYYDYFIRCCFMITYPILNTWAIWHVYEAEELANKLLSIAVVIQMFQCEYNMFFFIYSIVV